MTKLYVVRHAHAGKRSAWDREDGLRPLSPKGVRQSAALVDLLAPGGPKRLVASPAVRCIDTLRPLAEKLSLEVEVDDRLAEGATGPEALALLAELAAIGPAAVCSHGDVIPALLDTVLAAGATVTDEVQWPKASTWELTWEGGRAAVARYLGRP